MVYVVGVGVFVIAQIVTMVAFAELMPQGYFDLFRRLSWGRELMGLLMFAVALLITWGVLLLLGY